MKDLILSVYGNTFFDELLIWAVVSVVIMACFGSKLAEVLTTFNNRHHILGWNHLDDADIYSFDDESDNV